MAKKDQDDMSELIDDMLDQSGRYKIHNIGTSNGQYRQSPLGRFYGSEALATRAGKRCFLPGSNDPMGSDDFGNRGPAEGIVIYKAIAVILPRMPDNVDVYDIPEEG